MSSTSILNLHTKGAPSRKASSLIRDGKVAIGVALIAFGSKGICLKAHSFWVHGVLTGSRGVMDDILWRPVHFTSQPWLTTNPLITPFWTAQFLAQFRSCCTYRDNYFPLLGWVECLRNDFLLFHAQRLLLHLANWVKYLKNVVAYLFSLSCFACHFW